MRNACVHGHEIYFVSIMTNQLMNNYKFKTKISAGRMTAKANANMIYFPAPFLALCQLLSGVPPDRFSPGQCGFQDHWPGVRTFVQMSGIYTSSVF